MADTILRSQSTVIRAISNAYLGVDHRYKLKNARRLEVVLDDASIAYYVQLTAIGGDSEADAFVEAVPAGTPCNYHLNQGRLYYLDLKSASGTPNAQIKVS